MMRDRFEVQYATAQRYIVNLTMWNGKDTIDCRLIKEQTLQMRQAVCDLGLETLALKKKYDCFCSLQTDKRDVEVDVKDGKQRSLPDCITDTL